MCFCCLKTLENTERPWKFNRGFYTHKRQWCLRCAIEHCREYMKKHQARREECERLRLSRNGFAPAAERR